MCGLSAKCASIMRVNYIRMWHTYDMWILLAVIACMGLLVPTYAMAQTYDTPSSLVVVLPNPSYLYVDSDGYATVTGIVENNSDHSYIGNVQVLTRFYDNANEEPLAVNVSSISLDVLPPKSSSPFVIKSPSPDFSYVWAISSLQFFDSTNPKLTGLEMNHIQYDNGIITLNVTDSIEAPHTNVRMYVAYHDTFDPPRILSVSEHNLGDLEAGHTLSVDIQDAIPYGTGGFMIFAESDFFSSNMKSDRIPTSTTLLEPLLPPHIANIWVGNVTHPVTVLTADQEASINADVRPGRGEYHLNFQVTREGGGIVFLGGANITSTTGIVSANYTPIESGQYVVESFVWGGPSPVARPGPTMLFTVE